MVTEKSGAPTPHVVQPSDQVQRPAARPAYSRPAAQMRDLLKREISSRGTRYGISIRYRSMRAKTSSRIGGLASARTACAVVVHLNLLDSQYVICLGRARTPSRIAVTSTDTISKPGFGSRNGRLLMAYLQLFHSQDPGESGTFEVRTCCCTPSR